jgi:hypothetical protein
MKNEKKNRRILNRTLAKDMTPEELKKVSGGFATISSSHTFWSDDEDDSDDRPYY